jgi:hypothetical protein
MGRIIGRNAYLDVVSNQYLDAVLLHAPRKTSPDNDVIIALDFHDSGAQNLGDLTF